MAIKKKNTYMNDGRDLDHGLDKKKQEHRINVRFTNEEFEEIKVKAQQSEKSIGKYLRDSGIARVMSSTILPGNRERWMRIGRLGSELLQLKRAIFANNKIPKEFIDKLDEAVKEIKLLREQL